MVGETWAKQIEGLPFIEVGVRVYALSALLHANLLSSRPYINARSVWRPPLPPVEWEGTKKVEVGREQTVYYVSYGGGELHRSGWL